jgi:hypothetical protein
VDAARGLEPGEVREVVEAAVAGAGGDHHRARPGPTG